MAQETEWTLWKLMKVGKALLRVQNAAYKWPITKSKDENPPAVDCIEAILNAVEEIGIDDEFESLKPYITALKDLKAKWESEKKLIVNDDVKELRNTARELEEYLEVAADGYLIFVPTELGFEAKNYASASGIKSIIDGEVFPELPNIARQDLEEAGRCIAFEAPTAAACLILRAVEATLKCYCCALIGAPLPEDCKTWGDILQHIDQQGKVNSIELSSETRKLQKNLLTLLTKYRNPTMHPQETYELGKVKDLLKICQVRFKDMVKELKQRDKTLTDGWQLAGFD
jgi:hypothetical protein